MNNKFEKAYITKSISCGDSFEKQSSYSELMVYIVSNDYYIDRNINRLGSSNCFYIKIHGVIPYEQLLFRIGIPKREDKEEYINYLKIYKRSKMLDKFINS